MKKNLGLPIMLVLLGAVARLLPHPPNFAPIAAVAIFSGMYLKHWWSFIVPLLAMLGSDVVIGFYSLPIMISVYAGFAASFLLGRWIGKNKKLCRMIAGTVLSSILFFVLTNWAVWAFGTMYQHTLSGLIASYTMAIPFFRNSLLGDLFYTGILVSIMEIFLCPYTKTTVIQHPTSDI